jgi:hypothetical protein
MPLSNWRGKSGNEQKTGKCAGRVALGDMGRTTLAGTLKVEPTHEFLSGTTDKGILRRLVLCASLGMNAAEFTAHAVCGGRGRGLSRTVCSAGRSPWNRTTAPWGK